LAGVTFGFQVRKHLVEPHSDVASNIFRKDPTGPTFLDKPKHLRPEVTVIFLAAAFPGIGKWLARVSAGNNVNCWEHVSTEHPHI
jgi:hypothetical protein